MYVYLPLTCRTRRTMRACWSGRCRMYPPPYQGMLSHGLVTSSCSTRSSKMTQRPLGPSGWTAVDGKVWTMGFVSVSVVSGFDGANGRGGDLERSRVDVDVSAVVVAAAAAPPPPSRRPRGAEAGPEGRCHQVKWPRMGCMVLLVYFSLRFKDDCRLHNPLLPFSRSLFLALHPGCYTCRTAPMRESGTRGKLARFGSADAMSAGGMGQKEKYGWRLV